jgi:hypothetical protein
MHGVKRTAELYEAGVMRTSAAAEPDLAFSYTEFWAGHLFHIQFSLCTSLGKRLDVKYSNRKSFLNSALLSRLKNKGEIEWASTHDESSSARSRRWLRL